MYTVPGQGEAAGQQGRTEVVSGPLTGQLVLMDLGLLVIALVTLGSVTLACRSHSITSPPGLIFMQTHSWAQSCPAHWQCCHATSKLS